MVFNKINKKNILIFGFSRSGKAVLELGSETSDIFYIYDDNKELIINDLLKYANIELLNSKITDLKINSILNKIDLCVLSPGVPNSNNFLKKIKEKKIKIISEIEFAYQFLLKKNLSFYIIAITGTNGKTTTTSLINFLLNNIGISSVACGNIGLPLSAVVKDNNIFVVEISNFQLEYIIDFKPNISMILNIKPDHMDRYNYLEEYINAKKNIFKNQKDKDLLILNKDDLILNKISSNCYIEYFSTNEQIKKGAFLDSKDNVFYNNKLLMNMSEVNLKGKHNYQNIMSAVLALKYYGLSDKYLINGLKKFMPVSHRMEFVKKINGVDYINDSKATNIDSLASALASYKDNEVILIAGGRDKNSDYTEINSLIKQKVKLVLVIGEAKEKIIKAWGNIVSIKECNLMSDAVKKASEFAEKGDIVLLSPACASFDMYKNYEERGNDFKEIVSLIN